MTRPTISQAFAMRYSQRLRFRFDETDNAWRWLENTDGAIKKSDEIEFYNAARLTTDKPQATGQRLVAKVYPLLQDAIEAGVNWGWHYAHKYTDEPGEELVKERIRERVIGEILERFGVEGEGE